MTFYLVIGNFKYENIFLAEKRRKLWKYFKNGKIFF